MSEAEADQFMEDIRKKDSKKARHEFLAKMERKFNRREGVSSY